MSKIRVHELAKELNISSKVIIEKLKESGVEVSSHMSTLETDSVGRIKSLYEKKEKVVENKIEKTVKKSEPSDNKPKQEQKPYTGQQKSSNQPYKPNNQQNNNRQGGQKPGQGNAGQNKPQQSSSGHQTNQQGKQPLTSKPPFTGRQQSTGKQPFSKPQSQRPQDSTMRAQNRDGNQPTPAGNNNQRPASNNNQRQVSNNNQKPGFKSNTTTTPQKKFGENKQPQGRNNNQNNYRSNNNQNRQNRKPDAPKKPNPAPKPVAPPEPEIKLIQIPATLSIKELASFMRKSGSEVVKMLFKKGQLININSTIDYDTAVEIAEEYNIIVELEEEKDIFEEAFKDEPEDDKNLIKRPPVVVVMGHVDHGKTSLLDAIRKSKVTLGEAGGITQHIGAYTVDINGNPITFLDTPGHEAFTAMRMRGAQVTDIAVLVVAADDGVMPQTVEAINHAKAAGVEIIVAINKIDKPGANPDRVKQELTEHSILTEDWGGDTICVPVSALNKTGIDNLLEMIILASEIKELKANPDRNARGTVIDAKLDKGRGPVATVLVQNGTLSIGDPIVAGSTFGKIRAMMDDKGRRVKKAGPSTPVEILGLSEVPSAGDAFYVAENEKHARSVAETVVAKTRTDMIKSTPQKVSLDDLFTQIKSGNVKEINIVVKADVQGSVEAVKQSLEKLTNEEVRVCIIHGGVGTITESDVMLASASNAIIIGFNVRPETMAKTFAENEKVDIRLYKVIYNAIEDVKNAMKGMLDPVFEEKIIGHAQVRQLFKASGVGTIAGSYITDGKFQRGCSVRVFRGKEKIHEGELESLKRFKDDVKEVNTNYECGLVIKKFGDLKEEDVVEAYIMVEVPR